MKSPASEAIDIIQDEHRSMGAVVKGMQERVAAARQGREQADPYLLQAMFDYIEMVPDRLHHPKEDEVLFRLLRQRSAEAAPLLDELEGEHLQARELLGAMRSALESLRAGGRIDALERALGIYAAFLWQHMRREEEVVLPMALRELPATDWEAVAAAFQANRKVSW
jgi:hemerythrin-like domain-containing protein